MRIKPGNRHDNDNADITAISIFPVRAEILSDAREFLPSTDSDQPHFLSSKLGRNIDTQFCLLRHDTFGELKDALGSLMKSIAENPGQARRPNLGIEYTRAYSYPDACVSCLLLNARRGF